MMTLAERAERVTQEDVAAKMKRQLRRWQTDGLARPGWKVELAHDGDRYLATFHITGAQAPRTGMEWEAFRAYADGFADRRTAVMNRTPRRTPKKTPKGKKTDD
ncbi:hypothetical protein AB0M39_40140 [Streptomyces sp. NPDC051907]|uniref:hypothetical protein n=1 Tax=Streptomyces sp. NPDC051907 TaxID=3155284 RepID=UPI00344175E2